MATRSTIAVQLKDGSVQSVYAHWDGYPSNNGKILKNNYNTIEKVLELHEKGDISALQETLEKTTFYSTRSKWGGEDEKWEGVKPKTFKDLSDYEKNIQHEDYNYIFKDGKWFFKTYLGKKTIELTDEIIKSD